MTKRQANKLHQLRCDLIELSLKIQQAKRTGNKKAEARIEKKRESTVKQIEKAKRGNSR